MTEEHEEQAFDIEVLHRDEDIVVVNKPSGLLVHRGWDNDKVVAMTLVRDLVGCHVFPVHRLDRPTSGALIFALHKDAARVLSQSFEAGTVRKGYLALVRGITPDDGLIDNPVPKKPKGPRVDAVTRYRRIFTFERYSLVEAWPQTGRLHQIRRHLKHITHPLIGDVNYGKGDQNRLFRERFSLNRLALHAACISFNHPVSDVLVEIQAPMPVDMAGPLTQMGVPNELLSLASTGSGSLEPFVAGG
ncbi:MAG: pseudouridylate synthase [Deltaproteobacteria bacterium]|jgi:tRNA pseudouridine65 synthase|nr:pseudouridylate synthase [Deltaproteobacteria bacterium]MBT6433017.1 pseudouridylate synthase [Deltaproteobacteria bacterium]MBT6490737.1 pseudouridylate synthase [Deltaproteobacteria bacterium]